VFETVALSMSLFKRHVKDLYSTCLLKITSAS